MKLVPDRRCEHMHINTDVDVMRINQDGVAIDPPDETTVDWRVDVRISCADCGEPFRWTGVPLGLSPHQPMCSADATELRAPIQPASIADEFAAQMDPLFEEETP